MVALRMLAYAARARATTSATTGRGSSCYEYLKDIRTYFGWWRDHWLPASAAPRAGRGQLLTRPGRRRPGGAGRPPERFLVRKLGREFLVAARDIEWLQASGNYVNLHVRGHDYPLRSTMAASKTGSTRRASLRVHRSYLVNLDHVASIEPLDTGDARVHLRDGGMLPCSRRHRDALRGRVGGAVA